jgi:hypothetical protein
MVENLEIHLPGQVQFVDLEALEEFLNVDLVVFHYFSHKVE